MTAIDVTYRYQGTLKPEHMRALSDAFEIYGVRRIDVDEANHLITVEYDATRMTNEIVASILRRCRIAVTEKVDRNRAAEAPSPASPAR